MPSFRTADERIAEIGLERIDIAQGGSTELITPGMGAIGPGQEMVDFFGDGERPIEVKSIKDTVCMTARVALDRDRSAPTRVGLTPTSCGIEPTCAPRWPRWAREARHARLPASHSRRLDGVERSSKRPLFRSEAGRLGDLRQKIARCSKHPSSRRFPAARASSTSAFVHMQGLLWTTHRVRTRSRRRKGWEWRTKQSARRPVPGRPRPPNDWGAARRVGRADVPRFIRSDFGAGPKMKPGRNRKLDLLRWFMARAGRVPIRVTSVPNGALPNMLGGEDVDPPTRLPMSRKAASRPLSHRASTRRFSPRRSRPCRRAPCPA